MRDCNNPLLEQEKKEQYETLLLYLLDYYRLLAVKNKSPPSEDLLYAVYVHIHEMAAECWSSYSTYFCDFFQNILDKIKLFLVQAEDDLGEEKKLDSLSQD